MSHVIHVWESPVPDSLDAAAALLPSLAGQPAASPARFEALAVALRQRGADHRRRHPGDDSPWVLGEPGAHGGSAVWRLQVLPAQAELAAELLVAAARPLGFVVFDEQRPALWLPDGRVLGAAAPARAALGPEAPAPLRSKAQVFGLLHERLKPLLAPAGWTGRRQDALFTADNGRVRFEIGFGCVARAPEIQLALALSILPRLPPPWDALAVRWGDRCHVLVDELMAAAGLALPGPVVQAHVRYVRVTTESELLAFADACRSALESLLLPFLHTCQTLPELERRLNPRAGEAPAFVPSYIGPLVAAALGRPDVADLIEACIRARREPWVQDKYRQLAADIEQARHSPP